MTNMQNPPLIEGGQRRPLSDECHVIIHDTEDGLALVIDSKDPRDITLRFDFGACENLSMKVADGIEDAGPMRCNTISKSGTAMNLCELIVDPEAESFNMKYRVQCLVRNPKTGELEQVRPGGGAPGGAPAGGPQEEVKKITDSLTMIIAPGENHGYNIFFESTSPDTYVLAVDFGSSENLKAAPGPGMTVEGDNRVVGEVEQGGRVPFAQLSVVDFSKGSSALKYKIAQRTDPAKRLAKEEDDRKKAEEEAEKKAAAAEAARKAAEDAAEAEAEAARKEAERLEKEAEDQRKKEQEEAERREREAAEAQRKAEEEAERIRQEEEAAKKKAEEAAKAAEAAKEKAEEERLAAEAEAKRLKEEEEAALEARKEADRKRRRLALEALQKSEQTIRIKFEAEWRGYYLILLKKWKESRCQLCRQPFKDDEEIVNYKDTYRIKRACFDKADKCYVCGDILIGEYVQTKGANPKKMKKTCIEEYKKGTRPNCSHCGTKIMEDKWHTTPDGKHYKMGCRAAAGV